MNKILIILGVCAVVAIVGFLVYQTISNYQTLLGDEDESENYTMIVPEGGKIVPGDSSDRVRVPKASEGKLIAMVIAFDNFQDEEYFVLSQIFRAAGAEVIPASTQLGTARGAGGGEAQVDLLVKDLNFLDFDAVVFVGGPGALAELNNEASYSVIRAAVSDRKIVSAISLGPVVLAETGALRGKKATVWSSSEDRSGVEILEENGALYQENQVVADGLIVTGSGLEAAEAFAMKIVEMLL